MRILTYITLALIVILGFTFAVLNAEPVNLNLFVMSPEMPLSLLVALALVIGALLGALVGMTFFIKLKFKYRQLKKRVEMAEREVENLRALPLRDGA